MKINRLIVTKAEAEISIAEVTLLSSEEYDANRDLIPLIGKWWWLRSPGYDQYCAAIVNYGGFRSYADVDSDDGCVRPALRILNPESSNLEPGDRFEMAGHIWTVLRGGLALCNDMVGECAFRKDWRAKDANVYEASDVKKWLENWARENRLNF